MMYNAFESDSTLVGAGESPAVHPDRVIVFARFPDAGQVKTRLIPVLGAEGAARLQAALTRRTLDVARPFCSQRPCDLEVRFAGGDASSMSRMFGADTRYAAQQGADLGDRLEHAVTAAFSEGARRVVVIGADCPELDSALLEEAFEALSHAEVVLGPANDGGYYLIGMQANQPQLFRGIHWGTPNVLRQSLENAGRAQLSVRQLKPLSDVDHAEDLLVCRRVPEAFCEILPRPRTGLLSVVVPTFNEERTIKHTLGPIVGLPEIELIVADGGSTDATACVAREMGARVVPVRRGRGRQMNAGAALASGTTLLFLHADSQLPPNFVATIRSLLGESHIAGAFRLRIDAPGWPLRCVEWAANLRSRRLQMPYGDQALFVPAEVFFAIGGYPNWPLMEDYELCRRLRRQGRIGLAQDAIDASPRRWARLGVLRTTLINQGTLLGFHLGISPERLAAWYTGWLRKERPDNPTDRSGAEPP